MQSPFYNVYNNRKLIGSSYCTLWHVKIPTNVLTLWSAKKKKKTTTQNIKFVSPNLISARTSSNLSWDPSSLCGTLTEKSWCKGWEQSRQMKLLILSFQGPCSVLQSLAEQSAEWKIERSRILGLEIGFNWSVVMGMADTALLMILTENRWHTFPNVMAVQKLTWIFFNLIFNKDLIEQTEMFFFPFS